MRFRTRFRIIVPCLVFVTCLSILLTILRIGSPLQFRLPDRTMINTGTVQHVSAPPSEKLDTPKLTQTIDPQWTITSSCLPMFDASTIDTPFKFYIYDLPSRFNTDQSRCVEKNLRYNNCYNFTYCGMGDEIFKYSKKATSVEHDNEQSLEHGFATSVRNTHMFSLEVIMHYKLLHSPYRTLDAGKADMFYIPVYSGLAHLCNRDEQQQFIEDLFQYLKQNSSHFNAGKPHFAALGKIHREQPIMIRHPDSSKVTFIGIEQESNTKSPQWTGVYTISIIVAPYPSYVHFRDSRRDSRLLEYTHGLRSLNQSQFTLEVPSVWERNVLLLLAASTRRTNLFRAKIIDQFPIQTVKGVNEYFTETTRNKTVAQIMLVTTECSPVHRHTTIPWMSRSVFCLQPPGDSPTRKSFYDGILSGCIPVTFKTEYKTVYPFQNRLDYKKFMYEISMSKFANMSVIDIIKEIPRREVEALHNNLLRVAKWFQYSMPDGGPDEGDDAVTLILDEVRHKHGLKEELRVSERVR